ncbi:hypothetical protein CONLIGDRAFT_239169 [Coniochaeta ligniaria NRRL 30616]|uniref:Uncharacterized protein n=1 Tax=Coniochaeta ligniaria NRRL 30616 TaxID=1408157 RepID=A0A1J7IWQ5_9PEZI|nr:hypothetical protein CONLIGDRAFT_239169 [Coniochaeta ligniaria NRRL 30616]
MSSSTPNQPRKSRHKRKRSASVASLSRQRDLPPETINPHSHPPNLLKQFRAAGLPETERLPAVPNFPHRTLPRNYADPAGEEEDYEVRDGENGQDESGRETATDGDTDAELDPDARRRKAAKTRLAGVRRDRRERERNVGVLVGILRRCVAEGDMVRAKRAFGLLVRAKIDGRRVDLRSEGYWGLGAEILMREGETSSAGGGERSEGGEMKKRWGSVQNMVQVRRFFEDLIQLHPYNRLHPESISALDFYPVLFSCEMYNVHVELDMALHRVEEENEDDSGMQDDDVSRERRAKARKDELRDGALEVMRGVAGRMDELMSVLPYSKSLEMLRLRAMIALFMGDLEVPAPPRDEDEEEEGMRKRDTERDRAIMLFKKVLTGGGALEPWIRRLVAEHDNEGDDEESDGEEEAPLSLPMFSSLPIR